MDAMYAPSSQRLQTRFSDSLDKKGAYKYVHNGNFMFSNILCLSILALRHFLFKVTLFDAPDNPVLTLCELLQVTES
jgi:hypothetical protein